MSLVYAGVLSHAPGITGRAHLVENTAAQTAFYDALARQRQDIMQSGAEALIVIAAEHFANFFMNNMPAILRRNLRFFSRPHRRPRLG